VTVASKRQRAKRKATAKKTPKKKETAGKTAPQKPPARKTPGRFKLLLPLFGILLVVGLELLLRLAGVGRQTRLFLQLKRPDGTAVYRLNPRASERFFFRKFKGRPVAPSRVLPIEFPVRKPAGTIRIFALGGSTTAGFPYPRSAAFPGFLDALLRDIHPDRRFEVINCGLTALNSYAVLDFMPEVLRCQPDLIVIYSGHNEFYGCHGVGSLESLAANRTLVRLFIGLQKLSLYQLVSGAIGKFHSPATTKAVKDLITVMARDREIRKDSRKYRVAAENYRKNLEAIIKRALGARVPVVITTLVSNEKDLSPLRSAHEKGLSPQALEQWAKTWNRAVEAQKRGDLARAAELLRKSLEIDDEYAEAYFRLARAEAAQGRWKKARENFRKALEYDVLRFRAPPEFNEIIRKAVARFAESETPVVLADIAPVFEKNSPGGVIGYELITDHLHPNTRGNLLIAETICRALAQSPLADRFGPRWDFSRIRSLGEYEKDVGYTPIERFLTAEILLNLYENFPFDTQIDREKRLARLRRELDRCAATLTPEERREIMSWSGKFRTFLLHLKLGDTYMEKGRYAKAADAYRTALRHPGEGTDTDYQHAWIGLGTACLKIGRTDEALEAFRNALKFKGNHASIWYNIGQIYLGKNDAANARKAFEKVLDLIPRHTDALISLGIIWRDGRNFEKARRCFEQAALTTKGLVIGNYHLGRLDLMAGRGDSAIKHLEKALEADPKHVQSLRLLGFCYLRLHEFKKADKYFERALALDPDNAPTWYNRACAAAALGEKDRAIEYLERATTLGGEAMRKRSATDPAFVSLRKDPRFKALGMRRE